MYGWMWSSEVRSIVATKRGWKSVIMRWWWWCLWLCHLVNTSSVKAAISHHIDEYSNFPLFIPRYEVRRDAHNVTVTRGDVEKKLSNDIDVIDFANDFEMKNINKMKKRVSYAQMESAYQCTNNKPDLEASGALNLMRMAPPTINTVEWAW